MFATSDIMDQIVRITPKVSDLLPNKQLPCPEADCSDIFTNPANLQMHLERHHRREPMKSTTLTSNGQEISVNISLAKQYYCPIEGCLYYDTGEKSNKSFGCLKYVRQHYQKVHATKVFDCTKCGKSFGTKGMCARHELDCGLVYTCGTCGWRYKKRETLLTHARRKGHVLNIDKMSNTKMKSENCGNTVIIGTQTTTPFQILVKLSTQSQDQETQTEPVKIVEEQKKRKHSRTTKQVTISPKKTKQEIEDAGDSFVASNSLKENLMNKLAAESAIYSIYSLKNESTDVGNNQNDCFDTFPDTTTGLCDIETQTEKSVTTFFDPMLYSHMHTQTCDEFLSELGLADIQTQTNLSKDEATLASEPAGRNAYSMTSPGSHDDILVSTETQTSFTQCLLEYNETGTNSNGITQHTQTCDTLLEGLFGGQESDLIGNFQSTYTQT